MWRAGAAANGSKGAGASESWRLPRAWPGGARTACDAEGPRVVVASALAPLGRRAVVGEGPPPPPAKTYCRLGVVLLWPFGMSHVWACEVYPCRHPNRLGLSSRWTGLPL